MSRPCSANAQEGKDEEKGIKRIFGVNYSIISCRLLCRKAAGKN